MIGGKVTMDRSKFRRVKDSLEAKVLKRIIRQQSSVISKRVKSLVPKDTGALRFSIGTKVLTRKNSATAIIGARASYEATKKGKVKKPFKYAHLADKRKPYLAPALTQQDIAALKAMVRDEIQKALR